MESIKIKGKDYVMVNERLKAFREDHPNYPLITEIVSLTEESCVMKASILNENGQVLATGHAQEDRSSSMINNTSFVENCETSAWGRALGNFGYGIDTSIASANEVAMAIAKQEMQTKDEFCGDFVMPFGKYKGTIISMLPDDYVDWFLQNGNNEMIKTQMKEYKKWVYESEHPEIVEVSENQGNSFKGN